MSDFKTWITNKKIKWLEVIIGLLCTVFVIATIGFEIPRLSQPNHRLNAIIYDGFLNLKNHENRQHARVIMIDIDEKSILNEGRWPWPRNKMAKLIQTLSSNGVVSIALDIVMSEPEKNHAVGLLEKIEEENLEQVPPGFNEVLNQIKPEVDNDSVLATTLQETNVVLGFLFHYDHDIKKGTLPEPLQDESGQDYIASQYQLKQFNGYNGSYKLFTNASKQSGFVTNVPDFDGVVRRGVLLAGFNDKIYPSLALQTVKDYLLIDNISLITRDKGHQKAITGINLDGKIIPVCDDAQLMIPYYGPPGTFDYYSATDILQNKIEPHNLEGSIAVIGSSMILLSDLHESPVSTVFPGVEIQGSIISGILDDYVVSYFGWDTSNRLLLLLSLGLILSIVFPYIRITYKLVVMFMAISAVIIGTYSLFVYQNLFIEPAPLIYLMLLIAFANYAYEFYLERRQKAKINNLFGQYVPEAYVKQLVDNPEDSTMEGSTRTMTVFFADIRSFTTISEKLDAAGVKKLLNTFFTPLTEIIFNHKGTIDKYVGDMIVAFWGAPIKDDLHCKNAIDASLTIFEKLDEINQHMNEQGLPSVSIGIGLGTGKMNVGDMGSKFRRSYTVLGDIVNIASRLQDLTKFYQQDILVTEETKLGYDDVLWRFVDKVAVKGREAALSIYAPICYLNDADEKMIQEMDEFNDALTHYFNQNFERSLLAFEVLNKTYPEVYLYELYMSRSKVFLSEPPPSDWSGVYIHTTK